MTIEVIAWRKEDGRDVWTIKPTFGDPFEVVRLIDPHLPLSTVVEDAGDAARYRWLRDHSEPGACAIYLSVGMALHGIRFEPNTVDNFIDASMSTSAGKVKNDDEV